MTATLNWNTLNISGIVDGTTFGALASRRQVRALNAKENAAFEAKIKKSSKKDQAAIMVLTSWQIKAQADGSKKQKVVDQKARELESIHLARRQNPTGKNSD